MIEVVGVPAEGPDERARQLAAGAEVVIGGRRHLAMITEAWRAPSASAPPPSPGPELVAWPSPLKANLPALLDAVAGRRTVVLASGDPMVSGIGSTLVDLLGPDAVRIHPGLSSVALARARMGWAAESCDVVSLVGRDPARLRRYLGAGNRVIVLSGGPGTPGVIAGLLREVDMGAARLTVLSDLGTETEARLEATAAGFGEREVPALNVVCLELPRSASWTAGSLAPGLPDDAFENDGQLTKRHVRASALASLRPAPGELLWDVGAGAGSIGIEWARLDPRNRVVAIEHDAERAARIRRNAEALGVPELEVIEVEAGAAVGAVGVGAAGVGAGGVGGAGASAPAPDVPTPLPTPDAVFIGGGGSPEVVEACWQVLRPGGRLVVHTVTIETEQTVIDAWHRWGGELIRLGVETAAPIGRFTGWKPARTVVQWAATKPLGTAPADGPVPQATGEMS